MAQLTVLSATKAVSDVTSARTSPLQYDPIPAGYSAGHKTFVEGVQPTHIGAYRDLYYYADHETTYRTCRQILKMYHFREGLEFTNQAKYPETVKELHQFFENVNNNYQTLINILFEIEDDLNIADDGYLCLNKNYILNKQTGDIIYAHVKEIYRGNPMYYRMVTRDNSRLGGVFGRCLVCEANRFKDAEAFAVVREAQMRYNRELSPNVVFYYRDCKYDSIRNVFICPICGCRLYDVKYVVCKEMDTEEPVFFHIDEEVIHASKYSPSLLYGTSPIITLYNQMDTKMKFTQYLQSFLDYNRAPQGAIFINTANAEQVKQTLNQASLEYAENRYYLPIFAIDSQSSGNIAQYVRLTPFPEELKQLDIESKIRREISALLGVQNVMMNDLEGVGGLNSESLQVQVTDRAALAGQMVYNTQLFPRLMQQLSKYGQYEIPFDLSLIVKRTDNAENETRMVNLERSINLALAIKELGYRVEPDFTNLLGYDNKKLLPFTFTQMTPAEIREEQQLGLMEGEGKPEHSGTISQPARSKIPGFRTKQLLERDDLPIGAEMRGKRLFYKVRYSVYECGYISEKDWEDIEKLRELKIQNKIMKRREEELNYKVTRMYERSSPTTKVILNIAKKLENKEKVIEAIDKAILLYAGTQNRSIVKG